MEWIPDSLIELWLMIGIFNAIVLIIGLNIKGNDTLPNVTISQLMLAEAASIIGGPLWSITFIVVAIKYFLEEINKGR